MAESNTSLQDWIARESIAFSLDADAKLNGAIDRIVASLGDEVRLLGLGEALHGGEEILQFRNRLFQRLVERHCYSAIAVESSYPRGRIANQFVTSETSTTYDAIAQTGFNHGFGMLEANRELMEWMRDYNAKSSTQTKIRFYGVDGPMEMSGCDSPRQLLTWVLNYLAAADGVDNVARRERINELLGPDAVWQNPAAMMNNDQSVGRTPAANALRLEVEDLASELQVRRPELNARGNDEHYTDAVHHASLARQVLTYHAAMAQKSADLFGRLLGLRDAMMGDNLAFITAKERSRG
jgi:erythromycin esterase-like protein